MSISKEDMDIIDKSFNWVKESEQRLGQFASNEIAWRDITIKAMDTARIKLIDQVLKIINSSSSDCDRSMSKNDLIRMRREIKELKEDFNNAIN